MKRAVRLLVLLSLAVMASPTPAQAAPASGPAAAPWQEAAKRLTSRSPSGAPLETRPRRYAAYALDRAALRGKLADAPMELTRRAATAPVVLTLPAPDGSLQRFEAVESPVLAPGLARRHPGYRSYSAVGLDDPTATARFDINSLGFHASVRSADGMWYVDPAYKGDPSVYVSYFTRDIANVHGPLVEPEEIERPEGAPRVRSGPAGRAGEIVKQRVYRLALISDPAYAEYHGAANVTAAKQTLVNRVNQPYNDDLAIKLVLIDDNDRLNLDTEAEYRLPGGPCVIPCYPPGTGDGCDAQTLAQNNIAADAAVLPTSYDVGHIVLGVDGGGVALLGSAGDPTIKASGCTGLGTPTGDFFAIDYVAHEIGHQFGGNHTFNGTQHNCSGGNRNEETSVEPGSGSSIQAYAGICRQDNLQPHSDPYFSQRSIDEIQAHVTTDFGPGYTNQGDQVIDTPNHSPVVTAPPNRTIPIRTPFTLTGAVTDADGQTLVHTWEQNDAEEGEGTALVDNDKPDGPLFRIFGRYADVSPEEALLIPSPDENQATPADFTRTFPDMAQIAAGNTNAADGTCPEVVLAPPSPAPAPEPVAIPIVECYSEFLPTSARVMHFRLTSRDRFAAGGGVSHGDTTIAVDGRDPFRVTSQATPTAAAGGSELPVQWDVAGTDQAPFDVPNVRISYSTDGGLTFPTVLAASTPNDGAATVTVPNVATGDGRIKVEAVDNYFFDISRGDLTVTPSDATATPTATATATATATVTATATATVTATASPTVSPEPTAYPMRGFLRPSLRPTAKRIRVKGNRKVKLRVRCEVVPVTAATACRGSAALFARIDEGKRRRIAKKRITVARGTTRTVKVRINRRAFRRVTQAGSLRTKARVRANGRTARKIIRLRR